ncbi:MAG: LytTR family DNA-binding domain-containing protein [Ignavibacteriaceae bacterium]
MLDFLNRPYPFSFQPSRRIKQLVPIGLLVFAFLILFKPFGLDSDPGYIQTSAYLSFSGTVIGFLTTVLIPYYFPGYFNELKWTLKRNFIWNGYIFFIFATLMFFSFNIYSIYHFHNSQNFTFKNYLWWIYLQFIFGLPLGIIINLFNQYFLLKKHVKAADSINNLFKTSEVQNFQKSTVKINASPEYEKELNNSNELENRYSSVKLLEFEVDRFKKVNIDVENIFYFEAFGNYINIVYFDNGVKRITVRNTITNIEHKVSESKVIYRTHRSYLVNLEKIEKITGDSQGLKLHLKSIDKVIPVSRNKIKEFRKMVVSSI